MTPHRPILRILPLLPVLLLLTMPGWLPACGGGGSSQVAGGGIGGTGISGGPVTGFGSFFVTGTEWELGSGGTVEIDGEAADESALQLGMFARVEGVRAVDGSLGSASRVRVDEAVRGPVGGAPLLDGPDRLRFDVLGQRVEADQGQTVFVGTTFATLAENDVIDVFGPVGADGPIRATRIVKLGELALGTTEVELKGRVTGLVPDTSFALGSVGVALDDCDGADTAIDPGIAPLANGQAVEVEGILREALVVDACVVRPFTPLADELGEDAENVDLEGVVEDFAGLADFTVNGVPVDASEAELEPDDPDAFRDGVLVEVEGDVVGGVLRAAKLELAEGEARVAAEVTEAGLAGLANPVAGEIVLLDDGTSRVTVLVNPATRIEADDGEDEKLTLADLADGQLLEIRGIDLGEGRVRATEIEIEDDGEDGVELVGRIQSVDAGAMTITVLGVEVQVMASTELPDGYDDFTAFLGDPSIVGRLVEARNDGLTTTTFGVAAEVEFEDEDDD